MSEAEKQVQVTTGMGEGRQRQRKTEAETEIEPDRVEEVGLLRPWRIPVWPKRPDVVSGPPSLYPTKCWLGPQGPWTADRKGLKGTPWPQLLWSQPLGKGEVRTWGAGLPFDKLPPAAAASLWATSHSDRQSLCVTGPALESSCLEPTL